MLRTGFVIAILALFAGVLSAAPLCADLGAGPGLNPSLQAVITAEACQIGDKVFSDFVYSVSSSEGPIGPTASQVTFTALASDPLDPGFMLNSSWVAPAGGWIDVVLAYTVTAPGATIKDASLGVLGVSSNGAITGDSETLCLGGELGCDTVTMYPLTNQTVGVDWLGEYGAVQVVSAYKDIKLEDMGREGASFSIITQRFSQLSEIPEPATLFLMGGGLLVLGLAKRQARKRG